MELDKLDAKSRIMHAAVDLIGRQSNLNFTTREIAKKAELNEIVQFFEKETNMIYQELNKTHIEPKDRITKWANRTMEHLIEYPGILFMLATKLIKDNGNDAEINSMVENLKLNLEPIIKEYLKAKDKEAVSFKATQLLSGVITPILIYHGVGRKLEFDINNESTRKKYISSLIDSIL